MMTKNEFYIFEFPLTREIAEIGGSRSVWYCISKNVEEARRKLHEIISEIKPELIPFIDDALLVATTPIDTAFCLDGSLHLTPRLTALGY